MPNPSNSFLVEGEGETLFAVEMLFLVINKLLSLAMMILSLLVGFVYVDCQREMSVCLLVSGFLTLCVFLEMTGGMTRLFRSSLIGISIFSIVWNIYAAVLFMPVAAGPYPVCNNDEHVDAKGLIITGNVILGFRILFGLIPAILHTMYLYWAKLDWYEEVDTLSFLTTYASLL